MRTSVVFLLAGALQAAGVPTIDESLSMKSVSAPRISPDGRYVAYHAGSTNWEDNEFVTQIWVASTVTGERYQLTSGKKSATGPQWSPDSKRIAFVSDRDGKRQIYLISPAGGEAAQLTAEESGVGAIAWAPDGGAIAFTSSGPDAKAKKDRKDKYGDFEIVGGDYSMNHLWMVKVPAELPTDPKKLPKAERLTSGEQFTVGAFSWSPDGKRIAFAAQRDPDLGSSDTEQLYVLDLADLHVKKLLNANGPNGNPKWSPDGRQIAYVTSNGSPFFYYTNRNIAVIPAEGGTPCHPDRRFRRRSESGGLGSGRHLLHGASRRPRRRSSCWIRLRRRCGGSARPPISAPARPRFTKDYSTMAATGAAPESLHRGLHQLRSREFSPRILTDVAAQYKDYRLAAREVVQWKSSDGTTIEGVLIKPADYDPARKYPLLVVIHGGPTGVDTPLRTPDRTYPVERFAAKGALILKPNYRGSAGYGAKFRALNVRNLGVGDYEDVISGVDFLIAKGMVDKDRVASMGWSQGGYISAFITCYSDRFKAVSVGAGISDWMTYYVNTDIHPFTRQYLKGTPWDDPEIYRKTSPITYVSRAKTPTLIQHGDQDKRVPPPNAFELYQALRDRNVPAKLILYKGFGHGIDKPKQQRAVMEHNYEWFSKYIWGEEQSQ